jgi:hypothetical protein
MGLGRPWTMRSRPNYETHNASLMTTESASSAAIGSCPSAGVTPSVSRTACG